MKTNQPKAEATPRPWSLSVRKNNKPMSCLSPDEMCGIFAESGTLRIATIHGYLNQEVSNAALIVKAVNEYDALNAVAEAARRSESYHKDAVLQDSINKLDWLRKQ